MTVKAAVLFSLLMWVLAGPSSSQDGYLGMSLPADFQVFSDDSPWNTPILPDAEVHPDSDLMIGNLEAVLNGDPELWPYLAAAWFEWTSPIHVIDAVASPLIDIPTSGDGLYWTVDPDGDGVAQDIPMPAEGVWQDPQVDANMVLVDPAQRLAWEYTFAEPLGEGQWRAGRIDVWDLGGPGWRPAFVGPRWWRVGSTASGLSRLAGMVRIEEVMAGEIRHALIGGSPINRARGSAGGNDRELCLPAMNTDGFGIGPQFIPEGARLQLDPDLDLDALGLSPHAQVVARALQTYGMYVAKNSNGFSVDFQNLGPMENSPWLSVASVFQINMLDPGLFRVLACETVSKDATATPEVGVQIQGAPVDVMAGTTIPPITVILVDAAGQRIYTGREFEIMVDIGLIPGTNPALAALSGTRVRHTRLGQAVFDDLVIDRAGEDLRLFAMPRDLVVAVSPPFQVVGGEIFLDGFESGDLAAWSSIQFGTSIRSPR